MRLRLAAAAAVILLPFTASADLNSIELKLVYGQDVKLESYSGITVRARCHKSVVETQNGLQTNDTITIYATTTSDAAMKGLNEYLGGDSYLTAATPWEQSVLLQHSAMEGMESFQGVNLSFPVGWAYNIQNEAGLGVEAESSLLAVNPGGHQGCVISVNVDKINEPDNAKGGFFEEEEEYLPE